MEEVLKFFCVFQIIQIMVTRTPTRTHWLMAIVEVNPG